MSDLLAQAQGDRLLIPVEVPEGAQALALLERIAAAVEDTGKKAEDAGKKADTGASAWSRAADAFNEIRAAAGAMIEGINGLVDGLVAGAEESAALSDRARELGLDFDEAAESAGRFMDETAAMGAANELAARRVALSQEQLNALTRVAGAASQTLRITSEEGVERLTAALVSGRQRALAPFGEELARVARGGSTMSERLDALVRDANRTAPAVDNARDAVNRFRDSVDDLKRDFASGFVEGLRRMEEIGDRARGARDGVADLNGDVRALGGFIGETLSRAANGFRAVLAFLGLGVETILTSVGALGAALEAVAGGNVRGAGAAARAYFRDSADNGRLGEIFAELRAAVAAVNAQAEAGPGPAPPAGGAGRGQGGGVPPPEGGGGGGRSRRPAGADMSFGLDEATYGEAGLADRAREQAERGLRAQEARERAESRTRERAVVDRLRDRTREERDRDKAQEREKDDAAKRLENLRDFTSQFRALHQEQISVASSAASSLNASFGALGQSLAAHFQSIIAGQETLGEALRGILSDTLDSIAKEAYAKGGFYFAEGLARLVMYDFPGAGTSFAASAAYFAAGAGAQALGAAVAPPSQPSGGGSAASPSGGGDRVLGAKTGNDNASGPAVVNHYYAPVIGGREASAAQVGTRMERFTDAAGRRQQRDRRVS